MKGAPRSSRRLALLLALAAAAPPCRAFDSRNVSAAMWACSAPGALSASFAASGGPPDAVGCGAEVLWLASQTMPALAYAAADLQAAYTILLLDRDAPNAAAPVRSPLIHMALADVAGQDLAAPNGSSAVPALATRTLARDAEGLEDCLLLLAALMKAA